MAQTPDKLETCDTIRPQLALLATEQLAPSEKQRVASHVASCASCTQEAAFAKVLSVSGPRLPLATPPTDLFDKIALATYAAPPRRTLRETLLSWVTPAPTRLALGTAFAVGIAALVVLPRLADKEGLHNPPATSQPVASQPQQKSMDSAPAYHTPATVDPVQPSLPATPEKAIAKSDVKTVTTPGKTKTPVTNTLTERPAVTAPGHTDLRIATAPPTNVRPQTAPAKTTVQSVQIATHKSAPVLPHHVARPVETVSHPKTVVAANPTPGMADEENDEESSESVGIDMDRMTRVAMAPPSDMRAPTPTTGGGAADEASGSKISRRFTLGGANTGGGALRTVLSSRSARDMGIANPNVSIVQAPAKID